MKRVVLAILLTASFSVNAMENDPHFFVDEDPKNWFHLDYKSAKRTITAQFRQGDCCGRVTKSLAINFVDVGICEFRDGRWHLCVNAERSHPEILDKLMGAIAKKEQSLKLPEEK